VPLEDAGDLFATENPEEGAVRRDVAVLLSTLPARQRALMIDVKLSGHSIEEAAQRSGMSVSAVKVSLHRALKLLSKRVRAEDEEAIDED
jgi:RNA polymerase sigma-70 factor (ECF subfamily)